MLNQMRVLIAVAAVALAASATPALEKGTEKSQLFEGCWVSAINQYVPMGQAAPGLTQCQGYRCTPTGVEVVSCPPVLPSPPCFVTVGDSQPYPYCCLHLVCPTTGAK